MSLVEALDLDSLRLLTLVVEVEDRFRICLDEEDEAQIQTVGDLLDAIRRKRAGKAANAR
jgi:acyl carrier protein